MARPVTPPLVRLMSRVVKQPDGCWLWTGTLSWVGYGIFSLPGENGKRRFTSPHRVAYELLVGPIPEGLQIDHLCFNKACVNPAHLEPVTAKENNRRYVAAKKVYCKRGHLRTGVMKTGVTFCKVCHREAVRTCRLRRLAREAEGRERSAQLQSASMQARVPAKPKRGVVR